MPVLRTLSYSVLTSCIRRTFGERCSQAISAAGAAFTVEDEQMMRSLARAAGIILVRSRIPQQTRRAFFASS